MKNITARTRAAALFGHPVGHSLSSLFQNAAFRAAGLDVVYLTFDVAPESLGAALGSVRALGLMGVNLTIPHKEAVIPLLDEVAPLAGVVGSVNTVVNREGRLRGETTDGAGFLRSLAEETGLVPENRVFMVAGTGGAGRAIAFSLADAGARVIALTNRTGEKAEKLAADIRRSYPGTPVYVVPFDGRSIFMRRERVDCLVNASSFGLEGETARLFDPGGFSGAPVVCDLIYHRETRLLADARAAGLKTVDGLGMLIYQGALAFEFWTGRPAPAQAMFAAVRASLQAGPGCAGK